MGIDASIYSLLDTKGLQSGLAGIGDAYAQGVEQKNRLSQLAQQSELTGQQVRAGQRAEALVPQKMADVAASIKEKDMRELSGALAFGIQQKNGYSNQGLMNSTYDEAIRRGLKDEDIAKLFQPWASVANQTDGVVVQPTAQEQQGVVSNYLQRANPEEAVKKGIDTMYPKHLVGDTSDLGKYQRERDALKLSNPNDPRVAEYDARIKKLNEIKPAGSSMWNQNLDTNTIETQAQLVAENKMPMPSGRAALTNAGAAIIKRSKEINSDITGQGFNTIKQAEVAFSKGKQADIVRNINVAFDHMGTAEKLATAMENGDIPAINFLGNQFSKMTGGDKVTNFESVKNIVADEVAKGVIGGQTALQDREGLADKIRSAGSPAQLSGVFNSWRSLLGGQFEGLNRQYKGSTGKDLSGDYISSDLKNYRSKNSHVQNNPHPQDNEAVTWAKANPNDPRSVKILQMNGM